MARIIRNRKRYFNCYDSNKIHKSERYSWSSKSNDFSVYRTRLIRKGVVYSPSYGELDFTLPLFDKFVLDQA